MRRIAMWKLGGGAGIAAFGLLLGGCSHAPADRVVPASGVATGDWVSYALPGKRLTVYRHVLFEGRPAIRAQADRSASLYRQQLVVDPPELGTLDFSWWVPALMDRADLSDREAEDAPVRVVLAFDGDLSRLSRKDRLMFELAETLTGEAPPYATLMYVWDNRSALETVIPGNRSDRIRKIVVDSGPSQLRSWRHHQRDIARDFERAFGEPPGRLIGVALMTDSDNTSSEAQGIYGPLRLTSPRGAVKSIEE